MPIDLTRLTNALTSKSHGNAQVINLLEYYLDIARKGQLGYCGLVCVTPQQEGAAVRAGDVKLEPWIIKGIDTLKESIETSVKNWQPPEPDVTLDESYVMYNAVLGPHGFDFANWLVDAEMTRRMMGAPGPLKVGFWIGSEGFEVPADDQGYKWYANVFKPLVDLFGFVEDPIAIRGHHKPFYGLHDVVEMCETGVEVPLLRDVSSLSPFQDRQGYITVTLREMGRWSYRNSDIPAWVKFAKYCKSKGDDVIFVRDTAKANERLGPWETCPEASLNLTKRLAVYQNAKVNFMNGNGPNALVYYGDRPYVIFNDVEEKNVADENSVTKHGWESMNKMLWGTQFPWAKPNQRLVWKKPILDNIIKEYDDFSNT
jgi:hypothetical protein